jgi:hypothetical protein
VNNCCIEVGALRKSNSCNYFLYYGKVTLANTWLVRQVVQHPNYFTKLKSFCCLPRYRTTIVVSNWVHTIIANFKTPIPFRDHSTFVLPWLRWMGSNETRKACAKLRQRYLPNHGTLVIVFLSGISKQFVFRSRGLSKILTLTPKIFFENPFLLVSPWYRLMGSYLKKMACKDYN